MTSNVSSNEATSQRPRLCKCGDEPVRLTSSTKNNPGRKFWRCPNWKVCVFFVNFFTAVFYWFDFERATLLLQYRWCCDYFFWVDEDSICNCFHCCAMLDEQKTKKIRKLQMKLEFERKKSKILGVLLVMVVLWSFIDWAPKNGLCRL